MQESDPAFFERLAHGQTPQVLWIGCADSRVPANQVVGAPPGEIFVHRNVANLAVHTDMNCLSVIQYAVDVLKVTDIMLVGHYGCGGIRAALEGGKNGLIDNWLRHIQDVARQHKDALDRCATFEARCDRLCELNVVEQMVNVTRTSIVQDAWDRGQPLEVHGCIYHLKDGLLKSLRVCSSSQEALLERYPEVIAKLSE